MAGEQAHERRDAAFAGGQLEGVGDGHRTII
jgi:hypothetical protein